MQGNLIISTKCSNKGKVSVKVKVSIQILPKAEMCLYQID